MDALDIDGRVQIPASELSWTAVTSGGPGGQHVNKVATKVHLRWDLGASTAVPAWAKARLRELAARRLDADGSVQIMCAATRSQGRNLELARLQLAALVRAALHRPKRRRPTAPSRGVKARRLADKRRHSDKKRQRRGDW